MERLIMLVKEILEKFNISIPLESKLLELDVEGTFKEYAVEQVRNGDKMYLFYDENSEIRLTPDRKDDTIMVHYLFKEGEDLGKSSFYSKRGHIVAEEVAVRDI